jgi:NAD+ diphosphatase
MINTNETKSKTLEKLLFIFSNQQLILTDKMEIPKENNKFIRNFSLVRQLQLSYTESSHYVAEIISNASLPKDLQLRNLKELYHLLPSNIMALAGKAYQLLEWDKSHQFCGECGSRTQIANHEHSRTCINPSCKRIFYPRISPVIIVAIERDQEILLARSPHFPPGIYSTLAGFVEPGESIEQAVHREVYEETDIKIKNLRYFASQPWPFPNSLIFGFQADYESGDIICAQNEIEDAAFFHIDKLPNIFPGNVTLSQWLLKDFRKRQGQNI